MGSLAFESVWQKVAALEGQEFETARGVRFTYRFHKTYVVVSSGHQSIPRTFFDKIHRRLAEATVDKLPPLQGQTFILAILTDPRLQV